MTTPSERRAQRAQEKLEKQQASSDVLRASILSEDAFSQPKLVQNPRNSGTKGVPKLYLIVCEDAVSGRFYLEDLVASMQLSSVKVAVFPSTMGTDPRNIVKCAEDKLSANNKIQKAFVVFDGDSALLGGTNKSHFDGAITLAAAHSNMQTFVSVPCLEFWFVLHYGLRDTAYERRFMDGGWTFCGSVCEELGEKIADGKGYAKSERNIFDRLEKDVPQGRSQAVRNAQRLRGAAEKKFSHPSTDMDLLVQALEELRTI